MTGGGGQRLLTANVRGSLQHYRALEGDKVDIIVTQ